MEQNNVVNPDLTNQSASEGEKTQPNANAGEGAGAPEAGTKTESALLLKSLQEEREKRRAQDEKMALLEEELSTLKSSHLTDAEAFSDEGKALEAKINSLRDEIVSLKNDSAERELKASNPIFKEKWQEFEEFRQLSENKGMNLRTAAKAFLVENGLLEPTRKGLERTTGGKGTPSASGMTMEEIKHLRETNFRKYQEMVKKGQIIFQ